MAFQMIPPRVSSSPPPLDSLPSVACTGDDDEDEEFGGFATHNSFDITGLSDKLPPTPDSSPAKFPNQASSGGSSSRVPHEGAQSAKNKENAKCGSESHEVEWSPCSSARDKSCSDSPHSFRVSDINGDLCGALETEDDADFGDFAHYSRGDSTSDQVNDACITSGGVRSSHCPSEVSENTDSANSFSVIATPPPLDHIADSVVVDDEFSRISPNTPLNHEEEEFGDFEGPNPPLDNGGEEFGDFSAFATETSTTSCPVSVNDTKGDNAIRETNRNEACVETAVHFEHPNSSLDQNTIISSEETSTLCDNARDGSESEEDISCEGKSKDASLGTNSNPDVSDRTCDLEDSKDSREREIGHDVVDDNLKDNKCQLEENSTAETEEKVTLSSAEATVLSSVAQSVEDKDVDVTEQNSADFGEFKCGESEVSASNSSIDDSNSIRTVGNTITENKITQSDVCKVVDEEGSVNRRNCVNDNINSSAENLHQDDDDDDADFGEFSKANDDEEDDLDFDDLREQVRKGTYGMEESGDAADDFGEFYDYGRERAVPDTQYDDSEEFGNFGTADVGIEETNDFGDFATVGSDDEFGDFAAPDWQGAKKVPEEGSDQEDEFGDFTSQHSSDTLSGNARFSWHDSSSQNDSPVLQKLENLVLKWIPRETTSCRSTGNQETHFVPTLFQSVEDDAFVWRQLENLEASAALTLSWGSMKAQTLYLSSVNVDARNIVSKSAMITLFGQKWSSSVPLFAQTLSFSPLTPAKPAENSGSLEGGNRGSVTPPVLATSVSPKLTNATKEGADAQLPVADERRSEEQIPPAKFDWTSSGLINPLEGPAYNSSLFDMDLLLSNSNNGKGATNEMLASLEREFLGEGGEKGTSNRIKGPPAPSPLVQQILGSGMNRSPSAATPLQSLSSEAKEVVKNLPDISFMRSRVLMFPIRGDE